MTETPEASPRLLDWFAAHAFAMDDDDRLAALARDARIIAVGEPMHGVEEPIEFRNRLMKLLVERGLISAIATESGLIESRRVNEYVMGGAGDAAEIARANMTWGFGEQEGTVELVRWVRAYNARSERKVKFYGFDVSGGWMGEIKHAARLFDEIESFCNKVGAPGFVAALLPFRDAFERHGLAALSDEERARLEAAFESTLAALQNNEAALSDAASVEDYAWALRAAEMLRPTYDMMRLWPEHDPRAGVPGPEAMAALFKLSEIRDFHMARNMHWLLDREGPDARMLMFAANGHVAAELQSHGHFTGWDNPKNAGVHLRAAMGAAYRVILCCAGNGPGGGHMQGRSPPGPVDLTLARLNRDRIVIDLRDAPDDPWLDAPQSIWHTPLRVRPAADALAYVQNLTASAMPSFAASD